MVGGGSWEGRLVRLSLSGTPVATSLLHGVAGIPFSHGWPTCALHAATPAAASPASPHKRLHRYHCCPDLRSSRACCASWGLPGAG